MLLYYSSSAPAYYFSSASENAGTTPSFGLWILPFGLLIVLFIAYDALAKSLSKQLLFALAAWGAIAVAFGALLEARGLSARAVYIHIGALFGTAMAANVWMRIWPAQKRIITAVKAGTAPDPADAAVAGLRSKHNTFMSIPLLLFMVSVHQDGMLAVSPPWLFAAIVIAVGFVGAWAIFGGAYVGAIVFVASGLNEPAGNVLLVLAAGSRLSQYIGATVGDGYVQLSSEGLAAGSGMWHMETDQLQRYRRAVDADETGRALEKVVATAAGKGVEISGHDALKSAPKGYDKEHPRIELLRYKGIVTWKSWPPAAWLRRWRCRGCCRPRSRGGWPRDPASRRRSAVRTPPPGGR